MLAQAKGLPTGTRVRPTGQQEEATGPPGVEAMLEAAAGVEAGVLSVEVPGDSADPALAQPAAAAPQVWEVAEAFAAAVVVAVVVGGADKR